MFRIFLIHRDRFPRTRMTTTSRQAIVRTIHGPLGCSVCILHLLRALAPGQVERGARCLCRAITGDKRDLRSAGSSLAYGRNSRKRRGGIAGGANSASPELTVDFYENQRILLLKQLFTKDAL